MLKLILLLLLVTTFHWYQVDAGKYVRDISLSLSDVTKTFKINMKLQRISSKRSVNIYFILSLNGECIRRVIFQCSKCNSNDSTQSMMLAMDCPQTIVPYNLTDGKISYLGRDKNLICGSYTATIISYDKRMMVFEAFKNKAITSSCFDIHKLRLSSLRRDCSSAKINIKFTPPISNRKYPVLEYRVTIKSRNRRSCILSTTFKCRDCNDNTTLLPDTDIKLEGCFRLRGKMTYSKKQRRISFQISDPRISLATKYIVIIEPATKCSKCPRSYKSLKTKSRHVCYKIRNLRMSSTRRDCSSAKMRISFNSSLSNSKWSVLKYRITIKSVANNKCILTTTLNCRDCKGRSKLLPDNDKKLRSCFKLNDNVTFGKNQRDIGFEIDNSRIAMGTNYSVIIEPATQCSRCTRSYKYYKTITRHACYQVRKLQISSTRRDCSSAKIRISFNISLSNSKWSVLKYRITIKTRTNNTCILTTTLNCRDCEGRTTLLPDNDNNLRGCIKLSNTVTFSKTDTLISVLIDNSRITMATEYTIIIQPATKCSKCLSSYKYYKTITRHACSSVRSLSITSDYLSCRTSKLHIKFRPPSSNNGQPVLRYIIRVKSSNGATCFLSATLDCRDCDDRTKLLQLDQKEKTVCQHLAGHWTFTKRLSTISLELRSSYIKMATYYKVTVESITKCKKCKSISKGITTVRKYSYPNQCRKCVTRCPIICRNDPRRRCSRSCFLFFCSTSCHTYYVRVCVKKCSPHCYWI